MICLYMLVGVKALWKGSICLTTGWMCVWVKTYKIWLRQSHKKISRQKDGKITLAMTMNVVFWMSNRQYGVITMEEFCRVKIYVLFAGCVLLCKEFLYIRLCVDVYCNNLLSVLLRCGIRLIDWGTRWDSNSLLQIC